MQQHRTKCALTPPCVAFDFHLHLQSIWKSSTLTLKRPRGWDIALFQFVRLIRKVYLWRVNSGVYVRIHFLHLSIQVFWILTLTVDCKEPEKWITCKCHLWHWWCKCSIVMPLTSTVLIRQRKWTASFTSQQNPKAVEDVNSPISHSRDFSLNDCNRLPSDIPQVSMKFKRLRILCWH